MKSLVGYTGFVGSNLMVEGSFDKYYNSKNIAEAFGTSPDLLVYAGIPAQKFIANKFPDQDLEIINNAIEQIKKINPKKIVLISTIDVYKNPVNVDETTNVKDNDNDPYGKNRQILEEWVENNYKENSLIVRLPGLYGINIKKNYIYDYINLIPSMLKEEVYLKELEKNKSLDQYYIKQENGFYKLKALNKQEEKELRKYYKNHDFNALNFTDSRAKFQFYNLKNLWNHINIALNNNIHKLNLATEPISISELYKYLTGKTFTNEISNKIPNYNYKTIYSDIFGGKDGYIYTKDYILEDIKNFINDALSYKLSISNIAWNKENDNKMYEYMKESNLKGIEIAPTRIIENSPYDNLNTIEEYSKYMKIKYNLEIASMQSIWYGKSENIFKSKKDREELLEYTKKAIDFAEKAGCKNIVFGCPKNRNMENEEEYKKCKLIAIDFFNEIGNYAKDKGVIFSLEANPKIYNTNFINTTKEAIDLVKEIGNDSIKVNLDLGTMIANNEDLNDLIDNIDYINHIHISEPYLAKIEQRKLHSNLKKLLDKEEYKGFVSIEMSNKNSIEDIEEAIKYVRKVFR